MPEGGKIKLPLVGEVNKKTAMIGGAVTVAIVGIAYYRHRKNAASASALSGSGGTVTDPAGNVCDALNPASGYCPGSPEDSQYLSQQSAGTGGYGSGYGTSGYGGFVTDAQGNTCTALDPATGLCPVSGGGVPGQTSVTTNAEWVLEAENQLGNTSTIQAALGYALSGQPVTKEQANIFNEARGLLGNPPQGYPPLNVVGGTHHPHPKHEVTIPALAGNRVENATSELQSLGLKAGIPHRKPDVAYVVTSTSPPRGTKVVTGSTVHLSIRPETVTKGGTVPPARVLPGGLR